MNRPNKELKRIARQNLTGRYGITMGAMLLANLIPSAFLFPFRLVLSMNSVSQYIIYYLAYFIILMLTLILSTGDYYLHLNIGRNLSYSIGNIFHCFKERPDCYILSFLFLFVKMLPCMVPCIVLFVLYLITSMIPFLVLAIILYIFALICAVIISLRYVLVFMLLVDNPYQKIRDVFAESRRLMNGRKKQLFLLELTFIGWSLLGILSCGIGFLWITPYFTQTLAVFYRDAIDDLPVQDVQSDF